MNSTLGNVGFPDNSGHSQTERAFHNNSRQTEMSPLLASRLWQKRDIPSCHPGEEM